MAYTSLFKKDDVRVTQTFSSTHKGLDLSRGVVEQPIYLPKKAVEGYVWKILSGYSYGGKYYANSPIIYIKHKDGSGSRYIHSYTKNVKVKVGDTLKAGDQICATGNSGYSFGDHLHFEWLTKWDDLNTRVDPAPYVIKDNQATFKIGDKVVFTAVQNIRTGSGTNYEVQRQTTIGEKATIKDGPRNQYGYVWFDMVFGNGSTGWVAEVDKFELAPVEPPQPPQQTECEKEVNRLTEVNKGLTEALAASQSTLKVSEERVGFLEGTLAIRDKELKDLEGDYQRVFEERNNFEKQYLEVVTELNELKAGRDSWINRLADILHKLFGGK